MEPKLADMGMLELISQFPCMAFQGGSWKKTWNYLNQYTSQTLCQFGYHLYKIRTQNVVYFLVGKINSPVNLNKTAKRVMYIVRHNTTKHYSKIIKKE